MTSPTPTPPDTTPAAAGFLAAVLAGGNVPDILKTPAVRAALRPDPDGPTLCQFLLLDRCTNPVHSPPGHVGPPFRYCENRDHDRAAFNRAVAQLTDQARTAALTPGSTSQDVAAARTALAGPEPAAEDPLFAIDTAQDRLLEQIPALAYTVGQLSQLATQAPDLRRLRAFVSGVHTRAALKIATANRHAATEAHARTRAETAAAAATEEAERHGEAARLSTEAAAAAATAHAAALLDQHREAEDRLTEAQNAAEQRILDLAEAHLLALAAAREQTEQAQADTARTKTQAREAVDEARDTAARRERAADQLAQDARTTAAATIDAAEQRARADVLTATNETERLRGQAETDAQRHRADLATVNADLAAARAETERIRTEADTSARAAQVRAAQDERDKTALDELLKAAQRDLATARAETQAALLRAEGGPGSGA